MRFKANTLFSVILVVCCPPACVGKRGLKKTTICAPEQSIQVDNQLHIYDDDRSVNITIGTGPRATDRALASMLLTIIHDQIGYQAEILNYEHTPEEWANEMDCDVGIAKLNCSKIPMIHIGVVETQETSLLKRKHVGDGGHLGVNIKLRWFVNTDEVDKAAPGIPPDDYRFFQNQSLASQFELDASTVERMTERSSGHRWCDATPCDSNGLYVPEWCEGEERCATLLASFPHENRDTIVRQIVELRLLVKVAWVGDKLDSFVMHRSREMKPVLFFDYSVSSLTRFSVTYTEVFFPSCSTASDVSGCMYQNAKLRKLYWKHLETAAPQIVALVKNAKIFPDQFRRIVTEAVDDERKLRQLACSLVNENRWSENVDVYPKIKIHAILPNNHSDLKSAIAKAVNKINKDYLEGFILEPHVVVGGCSREEILKQYIKDITESNSHIIGVIGPDCDRSLENLIAIAEYYKHIVLSYMVDAVDDTSKPKSEYFFRVQPDTSMLARAHMRFIENMEWRNFAAFTDSDQSTTFIENLRMAAQNNSRKFVRSYTYSKYESFKKPLQEIKREPTAKIIIGDFPEKTARQIMCEAQRLNMTGRNDYVWLLPFWLSERSFAHVKGLPCNEAEMREALEYSFVYRFREFADDPFVTDTNETVLEWKRSLLRENRTLDENAGFAYDAFWALGTSLGELFKDNKRFLQNLLSKDHGKSTDALREFAKKLRGSSFRGVTGTVKFNDNFRKPGSIFLSQFINGTLRHVATFDTRRSYDGVDDGSDFQLTRTEIMWRNEKPSDGSPSCAFEALAVALSISCDAANTIAICTMIVVSLVVVGGVGARIAHRHYEKKMKTLEQNQNTPFMLTEYQLPEDSVRIYRLIGTGAFGKVYFGDYVDEDQNVTTVAVKVTKDVTDANAKLELLTEAEVMKRFDHVNILQLIGVVLKPDKCQIVTEFMMYGNLKNYLQVRRHLVDKGDIGAAHLTRMALDICRGLSYLESLHYVHGDLACRNCLVHETLTIKIADFGFCKNLVDQGYYRIVRTGPMPLRWMSPELLRTGIYHKESDIWSFGIVLYEIITFGGYPYHDIDDRDVQEYIRGGGFPTIPQKISKELEALLCRTWALEKEGRPAAAELLEILSSAPELVHPCIEDGVMMLAEPLEDHPKGSRSGSTPTWASRYRVRRTDSSYSSRGNRITSMKVV